MPNVDLVVLTTARHEALVHPAKCRVYREVALRHTLEPAHQHPILQVPQMQALGGDVQQGQPLGRIHRKGHNRILLLNSGKAGEFTL